MKCISLKRFITIILIFSIFIIINTVILTYFYYSQKCTLDDNIYNENIIEENIENNLISNEYEHMKNLKEKYAEKKILALTFDDGPSKYTHDLIDELNKRNINVTFFVLGESIEKYPDTLEFAIDSGNEIGIHSYKHKLFTKLSTLEIQEQINLTQNFISKTGKITPSLIRVPYGALNDKVKKEIEKENLTSILWDVDTLDWKFKNTKKVYNYALKKIKGNDIILMHDTFKTSIESAVLLIDKLSSDEYVFVTVSTLLELKDIISDNTTPQ